MKFRFPVIIIDEDFRSENISGSGIRALAQATAGNFHVSLEPRTIMRLERDGGGSGGGREGSAAFAAALVKAMQRDADI